MVPRCAHLYFVGFLCTVYVADEILGCNQPCGMPQIVTNLDKLLLLFHTTRGSEPPSVK
jgi:hypothetical protein